MTLVEKITKKAEFISFMASKIDYTILKGADEKKVAKFCESAKKYGFYALCTWPEYVKLTSELLKDSEVKVCSVIGFPEGTMSTASKLKDLEVAIKGGATEFDMVMERAKFKFLDNYSVRKDIEDVVAEAKKASYNNIVKVIVETCELNYDEIRKACEIVSDAGADFIKTSTGYKDDFFRSMGEERAKKIEDVRAMKEKIDTMGSRLKIKAAGGIGTLEYAIAMIEAGASRLGIGSAATKIIDEIKY